MIFQVRLLLSDLEQAPILNAFVWCRPDYLVYAELEAAQISQSFRGYNCGSLVTVNTILDFFKVLLASDAIQMDHFENLSSFVVTNATLAVINDSVHT